MTLNIIDIAKLAGVSKSTVSRYLNNVYLVSASGEYCVIEVVNEPWKYLSLLGLVMMIAGAAIMFIKGPTPANCKRS